MNEQSKGSGTARARKSNVYFGVAGGLLALAGGLAAGHLVGKDAKAATTAPRAGSADTPAKPAPAADDPSTRALAQAVGERLGKTVTVHAGATQIALRWSDLGVVIDH